MTAPVASGWSISPGGALTHWKTPPFHGAHPEATFVLAGSGRSTPNIAGSDCYAYSC